MTRNKLYILLLSACALGYIWLAISINRSTSGIEVCLFKHFAKIPCPSCGSTRSVIALLNGDMEGALFWNPFGLILVTVLVASPLWIIYDLSMKRSTLFKLYISAEQVLNRKWIAIPAILLVLVNWIWNIYKGL
jgi:hypothetical protein